MADVVGEAVVLVRPDTTNFANEATAGVSSAGRKLGKIFATAFAVGGLAELGKSVIDAATEHQAAFTVLSQTLKNAGASNELYGQSIEALLEKEARLKGFSDEELASAFTRLVSATKNSEKAFVDVGRAEDLARARHIDLATAALILSKAEQGNYNTLQRAGIAVTAVTTATDYLKARRQAAIDQGAKFTSQQNAEYQAALKVAEAQDKQASSAAALEEVTRRFGGTATQFAGTAQGQFERLGVDLHQLKVTIGEDLLPALTSGAEKLGTWFTELSQNQGVQEQFRTGVHDIGEAFHDVAAIAETVGPPILRLADDLGGLVHVGEILAAVYGGNKILNYIAGIGAVEATAAGSTAVLSASISGLTAALQANTAALIANQGAAERSTIIYDAYGGTLATVTAEEGAASTGATVLGDTSAVAAGKVGLFSGAVGVLKKALLEYLAVYTAIKALQPDLGLDFSNSTAGFVPGDNGSPYQKGSPSDELYQAGIQGQKGPTLHFAGGATEQISQLSKTDAKAYHAGLASALASDTSAKDAAKKAIDTAAQTAKDSVTSGAAHTTLSQAGQSAIQTLTDSITTDQQDLANLKQSLSDTITQGIQAVNDAVQQAKGNLNSIGESLSSEIQKILIQPITDAQAKLQAAQDKLSLTSSRTTLRNLGQEILLPGGHSLSTDPQRALEQLQALEKKTGSPALTSFIQQYQSALIGEQQASLTVSSDTLTRLGQQAQRRIETLTDQFNAGRINQGALRSGISSVLRNAGINSTNAADILGPLGADTLNALVQGLGEQAGAIAGGPQRAGAGLLPSITRPEVTLLQSQKQIQSQQLEVTKKIHDIAKEQLKLAQKETGLKKAQQFTSSLAKNPGTQTKKTAALAGLPST